MANKKITCKHCGATMEVDEDKEIMYCPYCGSKELIENNDNTVVTLAKLAVKEKHRKEEQERIDDAKDEAEWNAMPSGQKALHYIGMILLFGWPFILIGVMAIITNI